VLTLNPEAIKAAETAAESMPHGARRCDVVREALQAALPYLVTRSVTQEPVRSARGIYEAFRHLEHLPVEEFHIAILDTQHRIQHTEMVTRGLLDTTIVHPREVFAVAIGRRAASIILVHNHPSGDVTPSSEDRSVTEQLVLAGRMLGIPVLDHVIIGDGHYCSFGERGLL
jgi:DNA repair protein RadC